jgi:hypothetical protein
MLAFFYQHQPDPSWLWLGGWEKERMWIDVNRWSWWWIDGSWWWLTWLTDGSWWWIIIDDGE